MAGRIDAVGGNVQFLADIQSDFATPVIPTTRLRLTVPEDLKAQRNFDISAEPTPYRGVVEITETTRAASGPLNFDLRTEGLGMIIRGAFGSEEDVETAEFVDGGIRCQVVEYVESNSVATVSRAVSSNVATLVTAAHDFIPGQQITVSGMTDATYDGTFIILSTPSTTSLTYALTHANEGTTPDTAGTVASDAALHADYIPDSFDTNGDLTVFYRTAGDPAGQLDHVDGTYTSFTANVFTLSADLTGVDPTEILAEDYIFQKNTNWTGVYTHMYQAGQHLNTVLTFGILRDIVAFYYYSCKINTYSETYDNQAIVKGSVEVFAGDEFFGGVLDDDVNTGDTSITMRDEGNDIRNFDIFYPSGGTIWIGDESGITFTTFDDNTGIISGIPPTGDGSIVDDHFQSPEREVIACASVTNVVLGVLDPPLASYNCNIGFRVVANGIAVGAMEVLSGSWELNNNLFTDKIPLGSRERIALPPGRRDVTGVVHVEFDSPEEYNRVVRGTKCRLEFDCVDQLTDINGTNVRKRHDTIFQNIKFLENTPTTPDLNLITYDLNFRALTGTNSSEVVKILVNSQSDPMAGG